MPEHCVARVTFVRNSASNHSNFKAPSSSYAVLIPSFCFYAIASKFLSGMRQSFCPYFRSRALPKQMSQCLSNDSVGCETTVEYIHDMNMPLALFRHARRVVEKKSTTYTALSIVHVLYLIAFMWSSFSYPAGTLQAPADSSPTTSPLNATWAMTSLPPKTP